MPLFTAYPRHDSDEVGYPRIYLFGDSLTERAFYGHNGGFGARLKEYYDGRVHVVNQGYSGYTTRILRDDFQRYILDDIEKRGPPEPPLITIFLGANDACFAGHDTMVPIDEYERHIRHYVDSILEHPGAKGTKVVLITPPPVDVPAPEGSSAMDLPSVVEVLRAVAKNDRGHRTWQSKRRFAEKIIEIGREYEDKTDRVAVLDFWTAITKFACKEHDLSFEELDAEDALPGSGMPGAKEFGRSIFTDGLHFGKKGYEVLSKELFDLLFSKWPELDRKNFQLHD